MVSSEGFRDKNNDRKKKRIRGLQHRETADQPIPNHLLHSTSRIPDKKRLYGLRRGNNIYASAGS